MGAISQTIDSVAYNKEADQGNDTIVEPMTTAAAATDDAFGAVVEGVASGLEIGYWKRWR